jgi:hypothetical protein
MAYEDNFIVNGPFFNKNKGRYFVIVKDKKTGKKRTTAYARWLMECHLQRPLDPNSETIQHLDRNKANDTIENLSILPRSEHSKRDTRRSRPLKFACDMCGKEFERSPRIVRDKSSQGKRGMFCSRKCAGTYARRLQLGKMDQLPIQPKPQSEYYRLEAQWEHAKDLFRKYASELDISNF